MIKHHQQFVWFGVLVFLILLSLGITYGVYASRQRQVTISLDCHAYNLDQCPSPSCVVCPPCPECSSISCQASTKCKSMGIDERWYQSLKNQRVN